MPLQGLICRLLTLDPVDRISLQEVKEHAWFYERGVTAEHLAARGGGAGGGGGAAMAGTAGLSAKQQAELGLECPPSRWDQVIQDLPFDDSMKKAVEMAMMTVGESQEMGIPVGISWAPEDDHGVGTQPEPAQEPPLDAPLVANTSYEMPALSSMDADGNWVDELPPVQSWITAQAFAAAQAAGRPVPQLPKSATGKPKPAAPWIAGIIYWIADQPGLQGITGLSVTPAANGRPAEFVRLPLQEKEEVIAGLIREVLKACGSGLKLAGWGAVSKQMRGDAANPAVAPGNELEPRQRKKWWINAYKGGNVRGDHSQAFVELAPELFLMQTVLLEKEKPGLLRSATERWLQENHGLATAPAVVGSSDGVGSAAQMELGVNLSTELDMLPSMGGDRPIPEGVPSSF